MKTKCNICNKLFNNNYCFGHHLKTTHKYTLKKYYDSFYKKETDGICIVCKTPTNWLPVKREYAKYCSQKCVNHSPRVFALKRKNSIKKWGVEHPKQSNIVKNKFKNTCIKKYGVDNPLKNKEIQKKRKQTNFKKYGVDNPLQNKEILHKAQQTNLLKYGNICSAQGKTVLEKTKQTNLQRYGNVNANTSEIIKNKKKDTFQAKYGVNSPFQINTDKIKKLWIDKYGVDNPTKNKEILEKAICNAKTSKEYMLPSGHIIYKQGYEPQFLDYIFKNNILKENELEYHPKGIKYIGIDNKEHYYFPDFYIPKWNLIVEIKSDYTEQKDINVNLKEQETKKQGFNYIRILNNKINKLLNFDNLLRTIKQWN